MSDTQQLALPGTPTLTIRQAARAAKCSKQTIMRCLIDGRIQGVRVSPRRWLVTMSREALAALPIQRRMARKTTRQPWRQRLPAAPNGRPSKAAQLHTLLALATIPADKRVYLLKLAEAFTAGELKLLTEL